MNGDLKLLTARTVAPIDGPVIRDGGLVFRAGRIVAVGAARELAKQFPGAAAFDLGSSVILPGLVNAHAHLELSCLKPDCPRVGSFGDWIKNLRARMRSSGTDLQEIISPAIATGLEQCRRFGVTAVGDICQQNHIVRPLLRDANLRCVSYGEVLGLGKLRSQFDTLLGRALDGGSQSDRLHVGLTPHAPYTVDLEGYRECLSIAREKHLPLATHLAETPDEQEFLEDHAGMFRQIWESVGQWLEPVPTFHGSPVQFAAAVGLLDYPTLLAHVNYCSDEELGILARGKTSVVFCPRTHAYFDHPPHRWREMLATGINVAAGTDSCASSPDLNLVDDLRLLRKIAPEVPAETIWRMATINAAKAIRMDEQIGTLIVGKHADVVAFDDVGENPLEAILREPMLPTSVWFAGEQL